MKFCNMNPSLTLPVMATLFVVSVLAADPPSTLRKAFLDCERQASLGAIDFTDAARCSQAYEQLLKREFQGNFSKLFAWWKTQQRGEASALAQAQP